MAFLNQLLETFKTSMEIPQPYGWFHLLFWALAIGFGILLCVTHKKGDDKRVRRVVFIVAVIVVLFEIYKQIVYNFTGGEEITFKYQWYIFPWQFCSIPMYVGLLTGIFRKGRIHNALCAFLATYAMFAGLCVMVYPGDVFIRFIGINIQTMVCHGSMIIVAIYLLYTQYVKLNHKTMLAAMSVFAVALGIAVLLNEVAYRVWLPEGETFNMFFVSPHFPPTLLVYSSVQAAVAYPWCLILYFAGFSAATYVILLFAMMIKKVYTLCKRKK